MKKQKGGAPAPGAPPLDPPLRPCYILCRCYKLRTTNLKVEITMSEWAQYSLAMYTTNLAAFPVPHPAFHCWQYGKRRKAGRGTRNEATTNLKLQTANDE